MMENQHPFMNIPDGQLEKLNGLQAEFVDDSSPVKVDLMCGVYRDDDGNPFVLPSVKKARQIMIDDSNWNHEYPPSHLGTKRYRELSAELFFGAESSLVRENRIVSMQALGASGACHMGALFLKLHYGPWKSGAPTRVYIPAETWANHPNVFSSLGLKTASLPYYNAATCSLDFHALNTAIEALPSQSVVVLQTSANNPTGCDPTPSQWRNLATTFRAKGHFAFLDAAYLGFATRSIYKDTESIRIFVNAGVPLLLAATYGKAFGLYGERVGILCVVAPAPDVAIRIEKQMKLQARAETGAMPIFGARIVELVLGDAGLRDIWEKDVEEMAGQLERRRIELRKYLEAWDTPGNWNHITEQVGLFSFMGLSAKQVDLLKEKYHVYVQETGRVSIGGLNSSNLEYVARTINAVIIKTAN